MVKFIMRTLWLHHSLTYLCSLQTPPVLHPAQKHARFRALLVIPLPRLTLCIPRVPGTVLSMFAEILLTSQLASTSTNDRLVCVRPSPCVRASFTLCACVLHLVCVRPSPCVRASFTLCACVLHLVCVRPSPCVRASFTLCACVLHLVCVRPSPCVRASFTLCACVLHLVCVRPSPCVRASFTLCACVLHLVCVRPSPCVRASFTLCACILHLGIVTFSYGRHSPLCRLLVMNVYCRLPHD